jgi:hypothetical protein
MTPIQIRLAFYAIGAAAVIAVIGASAAWLFEAGRDKGRTEVTAKWQDEKARLLNAAEAARADERIKTANDAAELRKIADDADSKTRAADRARAGADAAAAGLQRRVAQLAASCHRPAGSAGPAASGTSTADAGPLLAELSRRIDETAGELAAIADARGIAGAACERAYNALREPHADRP